MKHGARVTLLSMLLGSCELCVCVCLKMGKCVRMHTGLMCECFYRLQLAHMCVSECVQGEDVTIMSDSNNCWL